MSIPLSIAQTLLKLICSQINSNAAQTFFHLALRDTSFQTCNNAIIKGLNMAFLQPAKEQTQGFITALSIFLWSAMKVPRTKHNGALNSARGLPKNTLQYTTKIWFLHRDHTTENFRPKQLYECGRWSICCWKVAEILLPSRPKIQTTIKLKNYQKEPSNQIFSTEIQSTNRTQDTWPAALLKCWNFRDQTENFWHKLMSCLNL